MIKSKVILFFALVLELSSCTNNGNTYQESKSGMSWKIEKFSDEEKVSHYNSLVQFEWSICNNKDSVLFKNRLFLKIDSSRAEKGIFEALLLLKQGEQGCFLIDYADLEKDLMEDLLPHPTRIDTLQVLKHRIFIDRIFTREEFEQNRKQFLDWVSKQKPVNFNSIENKIIENYIENKQLEMNVSETGLYYQIFHDSSSVKTGFGKHVKILCKGGILDQAQTHASTLQDFYIGQELQVIKAIEEVLLKMEKGDSANIIAPSNLAFGEKGSSTGLIPPATPVFFGVRLLECE